MKTRNLSLATFILGAFGATIAACSAQSSGVPPRGDSGDTSTGDTSSGGSNTGVPTAGSGTVVTQPSGGSSSSTGGSPSQGVAGSTVIAPGGAGPVVGAGGSTPAPGTCVMAAGTIADLPIDDLEDGDNTIEAIGNRVGYWFTYNDGSGTQTPAADKTGLIPFKPTAGGAPQSPLFSAETNGTAFTTYVGMGFNFNNTAMKACVYNASAYSGITFWAKGNISLKAQITIPATTATTEDSGSCSTPMMCDDHFTLTPTPALTATWTQYKITFADAASWAQAGWGVKTTFDKSSLINMQFQAPTAVAFDYSIDDIRFF
ncbi:MAG TPA: carbohydrate binding domain-containing protein [Polyangiaceae bacterium]|jgi:hypothetical protein|nr:carbohydrate binding domain-containing protein [Polyangiaceae bacterium]